jgi:hypothetical protein
MEENMSQSDDQSRPESAAQGPGSNPQHGSEPAQQYGHPPYGQPAQPYGQPQYGQPQYGQPQFGQPQYGQPAYGQQPYGHQPAYGAQYGQAPAYGQYGSGQPAKPGTVVTAAVLGLIFGALGVISTLLIFVAGSTLSSIFGTESGNGDVAAGIFAFIVAIAVLMAAWTVVTIWGAVWALTGRSRVLLIVGGSIAIAFSLFALVASLSDNASGAGGVVWSVLMLVAAVAMVVLLTAKRSADFFAAHRARRGR